MCGTSWDSSESDFTLPTTPIMFNHGCSGLDGTGLDAFADRSVAGPVLVREGFVHNDNLLALVVVGVGEVSSGEERDFQRVEVARTDRSKFGDWCSFGVRGTAFDGEGDLVPRRYERQAATAADGGFFDTRQSGDAPQNFAHEGGALRSGEIAILVGIIGVREPHLRGDDVMRVEARTDLQELPEAAQEEAGADQKDQREGDFGGDQGAGDAHLALAGAGAAAAFSEAGDLIGAGGLQGGREAEDHASKNRNQKREEENAWADGHFTQARDICRREIQQGVFQHDHGKQSNASGNESEQYAFGEHLAMRRPRPGTESEADGNFAVASGGAGQEQIREIDAGDQQHESDGGEEYEKFGCERWR